MRRPDGGEPAAGAPEKLAVQVARRIEQEIIERQWPIGEVLGSETALRERLGVSRSILREAVRLLENSQVAKMRQGPGGGLVVCTPDPRSAIRGVVISLEYVGATVEQVVHARYVFERTAITALSESLTESGVRELRSHAAGEDLGRPEDFHIMLGRLSGNPLLELFIDILVRLSAAYTDRARGVPGSTEEEVQNAAVLHLEIANAVVAGDAGRAQAVLVAHLEEAATWLTRFVDPVAGERTATRPMDPDPDERPREKKMAEWLAGIIHDDIVDEGRHVGEVLGSEADFVARYRVSRSVFREAIRILEHYSVAGMRRGPGGGLVVLEPDPMSSMRTVALYMGFRGITAEHLRAVRDCIELGCLSAMLRSPDADLTSLRAEQSSCCSRCLRDRIDELSGHLVLKLLRQILAILWDEYGSGSRPGHSCDTEVPAAEREELDAIVDAVGARDHELAQFRMRRHLRGRQGW